MNFSTYLVTIAGVSDYPIVSLIMFIVFFALVSIWIFSIDKKELERIEKLPLD
jgi:cytochrome c oxidase cbb3-type subunit III